MHLFRCLLPVLLLSCLLVPLTAAAEGPITAVSLDVPDAWWVDAEDALDGTERFGSLLAIELARQSVLIGVRDELGLRTLDKTLGESGQFAGVLPLVIELDLFYYGDSHIRLKQGANKILDCRIPVRWDEHQREIPGTILHERFSREQVPESLRKAGLKGEPNQWLDHAPVPDHIVPLIDQLTLISQFRAARALHKVMREEGESPERLWALSRVYANLAQESRWFIRSQYAAFQARSILYAYRLRAKAPESMLGQLSVAYAWVMATHTHWAEPEIRALEKHLKNNPAPDSTDLLPWTTLLRACHRYDSVKLEEIMEAGGPTASVAALWGVVTNEFVGMDGLTFQAIERAMDINPLSTRNLYGGYDAMGVSAGHWLTEAAPEHFSLITTAQLTRIETAPEAVVSLLRSAAKSDELMSLQQLAQVALAMQDLIAKGKDPDEFSYAVLGTLIDEANALHILYRARFMRRQWGVDTSEYLREVAPALSRHPFRPLINAFVLPRNSSDPLMKKLASEFRPVPMNRMNLSTFSRHMPSDVVFANGWPGNQWWRKVNRSGFRSGSEWLYRTRWYGKENVSGRGSLARSMDTYDRHHPKRLALLVQYYDLPERRFNGIAKKYGHHAVVADALAFRMQEKGDIRSARDYAETAARAAPERKTLERQARLELLLGNEAKWLSLMESILALPDHGLNHARINQTIANTYMNQGRFVEALPYSKASADSWAGWAMDTYVINLMLLDMHDEAWRVGQRIDERYGQDYWAAENVKVWRGHADADTFTEAVERYWQQEHGGKRSEYTWRLVYTDMVLGQYQRALKRVTDSVDRAEFNPRMLLFGVVAAQHLGQDARRDKLLAMLIDFPLLDGERQRFSLLGDLMKQGLETGKIDWQAAAQWTKDHDPYGIEVAGNLGIFALKLPGGRERERGLSELLALAKDPAYRSETVNIARTLLRQEGYTNEQMLPSGFKGHTLPSGETE